jgi:hypothetical protein
MMARGGVASERWRRTAAGAVFALGLQSSPWYAAVMDGTNAGFYELKNYQ